MAALYLTVNLPINNNTNIATFANATAGKLNLPKTGLLVEYDGIINFIKLGYSSSLSITSTNNLTAIIFTVYGINNGYYITEYIRGPVGGGTSTVSTNNMFEKIIRVSISGNIATPFTLGSGRDVAVYCPGRQSQYSNTRPGFVSVVNAPAGGELTAGSAFLFTICHPYKILLNKTQLRNDANRPNSYELVQNGFTLAQLQAGLNTIPSTGTLQFVFSAINGILTFPVFCTMGWLD